MDKYYSCLIYPALSIYIIKRPVKQVDPGLAFFYLVDYNNKSNVVSRLNWTLFDKKLKIFSI
jgi:hypothetical protein